MGFVRTVVVNCAYLILTTIILFLAAWVEDQFSITAKFSAVPAIWQKQQARTSPSLPKVKEYGVDI